MTLKSKIQWLLDSRTTPEEAAHSAMPSRKEDDIITVVDSVSWSGSWQVRGEYIPPNDGYVVIQARNAQSETSSLVGVQFGNLRTQIISSGRQLIMGYMPVQKGRNTLYYGSALDDVKVQFVKVVGGVNLLSRRALSCLNSTLLSLWRNFSTTKRNQSQNYRTSDLLDNLFRYPLLGALIQTECALAQQPLSLRLTDGSARRIGIQTFYPSKTQQGIHYQSVSSGATKPLQHQIADCFCRATRAILSLSPSGQKTYQTSPGYVVSYSESGSRNNFYAGGATC